MEGQNVTAVLPTTCFPRLTRAVLPYDANHHVGGKIVKADKIGAKSLLKRGRGVVLKIGLSNDLEVT